MDANKLTTQELKDMLAERLAEERRQKEDRAADIPQPLEKPNYGKILASAIRHIRYVASADYCVDNDESHYIYEDVMDAIYGNEIWEWINARD